MPYRYSDALLTNLWRWLCSPAAKLASSGLHRTVTGLLRKTLAQLVADLRSALCALSVLQHRIA